MCVSASAHRALSCGMERGLPGCGGSILPLDGAVLMKPFTLLQAEGLVLALASRHCPAPKGCFAVLALPEMCPGGCALQFWFPAPCGHSHTEAARCSPSHAPRNLLQECAFTWDVARRQ